MAGDKFTSMMAGARMVVEALLPTDRLSVVTFDCDSKVVVRSTLLQDKARVLAALQRVRASGNTALFPGWKDGILQVFGHLDRTRLNRVLLLTDGQANNGETNPEVISAEVARLARQGVVTSTLGFGDGYNEDLLRRMALAGDGNHYYAPTAVSLPEIFRLELGGLLATMGTRVRLAVSAPQPYQVLTPLERDEAGALRLNDLIPGNPLSVLVRIWGRELRAEVSYTDLATGRTVTLHNHLQLPILTSAEFQRLAPQPQVECEIALLRAAWARDQAAKHLDDNQDDAAREVVSGALAALRLLAHQEGVQYHIEQLEELLVDISEERRAMARKKAYHGSHGHYKGQYR
jgi:Ca-activated chloride channel family protein